MHYKRCESYREFRKILRKHTKTADKQTTTGNINWHNCPWVSYYASFDDIRSDKSLREYLLSIINKPDWWLEYDGCRVICGGKVRTIYGLELTNEDIYWTTIDDDGNISSYAPINMKVSVLPADVKELSKEEPTHERFVKVHKIPLNHRVHTHSITDYSDLETDVAALCLLSGVEQWVTRDGLVVDKEVFHLWEEKGDAEE